MKEELYFFTKRIMDVSLAVLLGIIFSPVILIIMLLIKLESRGPILAKVGKRISQNGELFRLYKFRSMIANAHRLLKTDPKFRKAYEEQQEKGNYKIKKDPRITKIGKFIRKHSIDEIPQLFNVIKGDMSIIGPRAYYPEELEKQQQKYPHTKKLIKEALTIKPGITGLWQVSGRSELNFDKRIALDAYYAGQKSLWLDILILLKTPWVMITGKGAA